MNNRKKHGGRKLGTPNKTTSELRQTIKAIIESQFENIINDIELLKPYQRLDIITKLLPYAIPKLLPNEDDKIENEKIEVVFVQGKTIL